MFNLVIYITKDNCIYMKRQELANTIAKQLSTENFCFIH